MTPCSAALRLVTLRLNCPVEAIVPGLHRRWRVSLTGGEVIETDAVVLAVPAPVAARLLAAVSEQAAQYPEAHLL